MLTYFVNIFSILCNEKAHLFISSCCQTARMLIVHVYVTVIILFPIDSSMSRILMLQYECVQRIERQFQIRFVEMRLSSYFQLIVNDLFFSAACSYEGRFLFQLQMCQQQTVFSSFIKHKPNVVRNTPTAFKELQILPYFKSYYDYIIIYFI